MYHSCVNEIKISIFFLNMVVKVNNGSKSKPTHVLNGITPKSFSSEMSFSVISLVTVIVE